MSVSFCFKNEIAGDPLALFLVCVILFQCCSTPKPLYYAFMRESCYTGRGSCKLRAVLIILGALELIAVYKNILIHVEIPLARISAILEGRRLGNWSHWRLDWRSFPGCVRGHFTRRKTNHGRPVLGVRQSTPCRSMAPVQVSGLRISHKRHQRSGTLPFMSFGR